MAPMVKTLTPPELHKLDIEARKLEAETQEIEERRSRAARMDDLEADRRAAEIRNINAQAAEQEAKAALAEMSRRSSERRMVETDANDLYHHVYHFTDAVNDDSVRACISVLKYWERTAPGCEIELVFTSPGGSVIDGLALFDYIQATRRRGHKVTTMALGMAASMAGILLQAGDVRVMTQESWVLIHEISTLAWGKMGEVEDEVDWLKRVQDRIIEIFVSRSKGKLAKSYFKSHWNRKDWWVSSDEALKLGMVDEVR